MKKILVTGGAGYIGSHACKALANAGYIPVTLDNLVSGRKSAVRWGPFEHGDIRDYAQLSSVLRKHKPDSVMHFAGLLNVSESMNDPSNYYQTNVLGTLNLLESMRAESIEQIVFSSSAAVYGGSGDGMIAEDAPLKPMNPYGRTKLFAENMLKDFGRSHGLSWIALRYFNAAGSDPDGETGQNIGSAFHLIPRAMRALRTSRHPLMIFGTDYPTPDGTCIRDYVHVSDIAEAHVKALHALEAGGQSGAYNLGNQQGSSVREVVASIERVTGGKVPVEYHERRKGDPAVLISDARLAMEKLGWAPSFSTLDDIARTDWNWFQNDQETTY